MATAIRKFINVSWGHKLANLMEEENKKETE
jgi:hypothetical protein